MVASETQGEDDESEKVASVVGATEYTSQVVLSVLYKKKRNRVCDNKQVILVSTKRMGGLNQPARATMLQATRKLAHERSDWKGAGRQAMWAQDLLPEQWIEQDEESTSYNAGQL